MSFYLARFASRDFRNLSQEPLELHPRFNLFFGGNGQGKTNQLEAIYYLFTLRPMRPVRPQQLIQWGAQQSTVQGLVHGRVQRQLSATFSRRERKLKLNGAPPMRLDDYFEGTQVVAFTPEDIQLVRGAPDLRRRWLDRAVFNTELTYLSEVRQYLRVLGHRNALLKKAPVDDALIEVLDTQLVNAGVRIIRRRAALIQRLTPHLQNAFKRIFPERELDIEIIYNANLSRMPQADPEAEQETFEALASESFFEQLAKVRRRERERKSSMVGPHLDDVQFTFCGHPFKISASQGQTRALVLSLKVAEILEIEARSGQHPILILDDVAGELDPRHSAFLFQFLEETNGQVLLSTTDLNNIHLDDRDQYPRYHVRQGRTELLFTRGPHVTPDFEDDDDEEEGEPNQHPYELDVDWREGSEEGHGSEEGEEPEATEGLLHQEEPT